MSTHVSRANPWRNASPLGMIFSVLIVLFYTLVFLIPFGIAIWLSFQNSGTALSVRELQLPAANHIRFYYMNIKQLTERTQPLYR